MSGDKIIRGPGEAARYVRGHRGAAVRAAQVPESIDVPAVRRKLGLSRREFALRFGINPLTVRDWEQGRRSPERPARAFLTLIDKEPAAVERALKVR